MSAKVIELRPRAQRYARPRRLFAALRWRLRDVGPALIAIGLIAAALTAAAFLAVCGMELLAGLLP